MSKQHPLLNKNIGLSSSIGAGLGYVAGKPSGNAASAAIAGAGLGALLGWFAANTSSRSLDRSEVGVSDTSIPHTNTSNTHSSDAAEINVLDGVLERVTAATGLDTHTVISAAIDHFLKK